MDILSRSEMTLGPDLFLPSVFMSRMRMRGSCWPSALSVSFTREYFPVRALWMLSREGVAEPRTTAQSSRWARSTARSRPW